MLFLCLLQKELENCLPLKESIFFHVVNDIHPQGTCCGEVIFSIGHVIYIF